MAFEAELSDLRPLQHLRVCRAVRSVAGGATFELEWTVFEDERSLLVCVAPYARRIGADGQFRLLLLESSVRIVTIAAPHGAFEYLVVEWLTELRFRFVVARHAELRLI